MDIVERAAALLGAAGATRRRLDPNVDFQVARRVDRLEHAAAEAVMPRAPGTRAEPSGRPEEGVADACTTPRSRSIAVDVGWLRAHRIVTPAESRTVMTESFRRVKRHILANMNDPGFGPRRNLVMITSSLPREGKTFCSVNLAISIAMEVDRTVMLVDADVENSCVAAALGITADLPRGFIDLVADPSLDLAEVLYRTNLGKLTLVPAGAPRAHTTELFAGDATARLLEEMAGRYPDRVIIFDTAPLLVASESCALAAHMGQIVVVVEAGRTAERSLREALASVQSAKLAGVVLNKGAPSSACGEYGYGYGAVKE